MAIVSSFRSGTSGVIDGTDTASYSFAAADIGVASLDRHVLVGVNGRGAATRTFTGFTIAGITATAVGAQLDNSFNTSAFYIAPVPTGTTGTIAFTLDAAWVRAQIGVWALTGLGSMTSTDRQTDTTFTTNTVNVSMSCRAGGAIFALANHINDASMTGWGTWAGVAEDFDANVEAQGRGAGAHTDYATAQTALAVSAVRTGGTGTTPTLLVIALAPAPLGIKRRGGLPFVGRNTGIW